MTIQREKMKMRCSALGQGKSIWTTLTHICGAAHWIICRKGQVSPLGTGKTLR